MTEHKDITGQQMIIISEAIMNGGLSQHSVVAINEHLRQNHKSLADGGVEELVERARHQFATLTGKIDPNDLVSSN